MNSCLIIVRLHGVLLLLLLLLLLCMYRGLVGFQTVRVTDKALLIHYSTQHTLTTRHVLSVLRSACED